MRIKSHVQVSLIVRAAMLAALIGFVLGCGTTSSGPSTGSSAAPASQKTADGLIKVETEADGDLYIRPEHGIGGYDAIVIAEAFVNYRRSSARLEPEDEEVYIISLEQALVDEANSIGAPIRYEPGECVLKVGIGFLNVNLARNDSSAVLGEMLLVIEYRDSMSDESLLRLMVPKQIDREPEGVSRADHVSQSFDRMIDEVDVTTALRSATKVPSAPRPGCEGRLVNAGLPSVSSSGQ